MPLTKRILLAAVCLAVGAGALDARNVFVMPGTGGQTISVFSGDPLGTPATVPGPQGFIALARPDGARYYVLAREASDSLLILDSNFNRISGKSLGDDIRAALITPDGRRLLVLTATLRVFDTETGEEIVPRSAPDVGAVPVDMAVSQDSKRAFILSSSAQRVIAIDISSASLPTAGSVILGGGDYLGIAVGPNGLVYASLVNQVVVIDPVTVTRLDPVFGVNGLPGRLAFTADGQRAIAVNRQGTTGSSAFVFDLASRAVTTVPTMGQGLEEIAVAGNNRAFATSNGRLLYDLTLSPPAISQAAFAGLSSLSGVTGFALSNELPAARYLYLAASSAVSRVDLSNGIESGRVPLATLTGKVSFAGPASLGPAASGLSYNAGQNVPPGTALRPLIARFLDVSGKPAAGVPVSWASASPDVVFGERGSLTTKEGFVQALATAPAVPGTYKVTATSGAAKVDFDFLTTTSGGGGAVTPGGGGIYTFSGNGQLVREQSLSNEPLVVLVKNPDGSPASGKQVTFELTQGSLSLSGSSVYSCSQSVCVTDVNGKTGIDFTASVTDGSSISQAIVTARLDNGIGVPFNVVIYQGGMGGMFGSNYASPPSVVLIKPALGETITGGVGETIPGAIQVFVASGTNAPLQNVGLAAITGLDAAEGPVVSCPANLLSDAAGKVSCDLTFGGKLGGPVTMEIRIGAGYRVYYGRVAVKVGPPAKMRIVAGNNQSGGAGQRLPTAAYVEVSDSGGNLLAGVPVSWEIAQQGTLTLANAQAVTDANGRARADITLGQAAGVAALRVKAGAATVTFSFTVSVNITKLVKTGGDGQQALVNQPYAQPLGVQVLDDQNRPVSGTTVAFSVLSGNAAINPAVMATDANGKVLVAVTAGPLAGTTQIRATVGTLSETFTLTSRLPGPVVASTGFRNAASNSPGVTPGGIAIVRGSGMAPGVQGLQVASLIPGQLPTQFLGIEIQFGGVPAPIFWVSSQGGIEEIAFQVPFETPPGPSTVLIRSAGGGSSTVPNIQVLPVQPGIFATAIGNRRFAVATRPDGSFIGPDNPAARGEIIRFFATGLGQTTPATATNRTGVPGQTVLAPMVAGLNDAGVQVISAEYLEGAIGIYAIAIEIPMTTATGPAQPLGFGVRGADGNLVFADDTQIPIR
jgi:uncharacterized protein (TIGR03437 family)